jgi:O-succinylbenzoate synthase
MSSEKSDAIVIRQVDFSETSRVVTFFTREFGKVPLMVDANAAYTLDDADHLARLDAYDLMMIEQPLEYDDVMDHVGLQQRLETAICLDESIHTVRIARDAIAAGACRIINIKPGRVGGHRESIRLHDVCAEHGIPVWHGGMLETGIGRAGAVALAARGGWSFATDLGPSSRYFDEDVCAPIRGNDVAVGVPRGPGIGRTPDPDRLAAVTVATAELPFSG